MELGEEVVYTEKLPYGMTLEIDGVLMIGTNKEAKEKESA